MGQTKSKSTEVDIERDTGSLGDHKLLDFAAARMQGKRQFMEDADAMQFGIKDYRWIAMFGVFDGHGGLAGARASRFIADNLLDCITEVLPPSKAGENISKHELLEATLTAFEEIDNRMRSLPKYVKSPVLGCQLSAPLGFDYAGATAEVCFVTPDEYVVANLGDSRVVLCRNGKMAFETEDHKPWEAGELARIKKAGGKCIDDRVGGNLAVSRTLGDFAYKKNLNFGPENQIVSCFPWVTILDRHPLDEFIIVACDGIWDVFTSTEAVDFVRHMLKESKDMGFISKSLVQEAYKRGSLDNLTCIVIRITDCPDSSSGDSASSVSSSSTYNHEPTAVHRVRKHSRHDSIYIPYQEEFIQSITA